MNIKPKKILIIDDEAVFREIITNALTSYGYQCIPADTPAKGILRLKGEPFDLILLDILMDPVDGWDTLAHIRSCSNGVDIPVIMASVKNLDIDEIFRYGEYVAGFITKPQIDVDLCEEISNFFSWYDSLIMTAKAAEMQGVQKDVCTKWIRICRQIRVLNQLISLVHSQSIPDESFTEEEHYTKRIRQIRHIIANKIKERDELIILYPVFTP